MEEKFIHKLREVFPNKTEEELIQIGIFLTTISELYVEFIEEHTTKNVA